MTDTEKLIAEVYDKILNHRFDGSKHELLALCERACYALEESERQKEEAERALGSIVSQTDVMG